MDDVVPARPGENVRGQGIIDMAATKTRVAILGGGIGALSAAFALSEIDPRGERYEITLYQLGWRLGGKTASGRNAKQGQRIEEHGLHIWAGFYENAFTILRAALKALDAPPNDPIRTIDDAFKRQNEIFYAEYTDGQWLPWPFWFQPDVDESVYPGRDSLWAPADNIVPPLSTLLLRTIASIIFNLNYYLEDWPGDQNAELAKAIAAMPAERRARLAAVSPDGKGHPLLLLAHRVGEKLHSDVEAIRRDAQGDMAALLHAFRGIVKEHQTIDGLEEGLRRLLILANLGICMLLGIIENDCLTDGLEVLDRYEFRSFLAQQDEEAANNAIVTALYEYIFAFRNGSREPSQQQVSACSAVQGLLRLFFTYKGAFFYKSVVGMGDTICTPIYQLLARRGVNFKFFHKVTSLEPTEDGSNIATIHIDKQVEFVDGRYDPLVLVKDYWCWPSEPKWQEIENGEYYALKGYNFENAYGPPNPPQPPPAARLSLQLGEDFDQVVLGISVGALDEICRPLMQQKPAWADMVGNLPTVRTMALQLWLDCAVGDLGGPYVAPGPSLETMGPIVTTCKPPLDTYSDMSQLLPAEDWPAPGPRSIAYYCAIMSDDSAPNDEQLAADYVKNASKDWMTSWLDTLWTNIGSGSTFRWDLLHAPSDISGSARLDFQFWRANINPSERYVLSLPGTLRHRMEPGKSGYDNLFLAGDWTRVPEINAGCVEVAAMSGLAAASALSGVYIPIVSTSPEPYITNAYVNYAGWITLPPAPYICNDSTFYGFAIPADLGACQRFLDRSFNRVAGRDQFRVMLDMAFVNVIQVRKSQAATPPFAEQGTMSETDVGLWLLVGSYERGAVLPKTIGFVPAYLFVDNAWSVVAGQEVWGFPKYHATIVQPISAPSNDPFDVSGLAIASYGPEAHASQQRIIQIEGTAGSTPTAAASPADAFRQLCAGADQERMKQLTSGPGMASFLGGVWGLPIPVFYLKQARSADSLTAASYKTLLNGALDLTGLRSWQLQSGNWSIEMSALDSLPFIRDLGLGTPVDGKLVLTATTRVWAEIDFTVARASPMA